MRRVVKVGGSLLLRPDLTEALTAWLDRQPAADTSFVFGGGELIDAVRHWDAIRPADAAELHWRCVDLLHFTFVTAAEWFADWRQIDGQAALARSIGEAASADTGQATASPAIVSVRSFYAREIPSRLPLNWQTTTDAIAAELAIGVGADELVLLKACEVPPGVEIEQLSRQGIVDQALPQIAGEVTAIRVEKLTEASR